MTVVARFAWMFSVVAILAFGQAAGASEPVTLSVWINTSYWESPSLRYPEFVKWFEENNPDIMLDINFYSGDENEGFLILAAAGVPMDVFNMGGHPDRALASSFLDLRPFMERDPLTPREWFHPVILREIEERDPRRWPYTFTLRLYMLNENHFTESGVPVPSLNAQTTWTTEEFASAIAALTRLNADGSVARYGFSMAAIQDRFRMWLRSFGGDLFDPVTQRIALDTEPAAEALNYLRNLIDRQYMRIGGANASALINGETAVYIGPDSNVELLEPSMAYEYAIAPQPRGQGGTAVRVGAHTYRIVATSAHPQEAWRYVRDRQLFQLGYLDLDNLPPRQNLMDFIVGKGLSIEPAMRQLMEEWVGDPQTAVLTEGELEGFHLWSGSVPEGPNVVRAFERYLLSEISYAALLEEARRANVLIDDLLGR